MQPPLGERVYRLEEMAARHDEWIKEHSVRAEKQDADLEELKMRDRESKVTQRLQVALGSLGGTLIVMLVAFIATRGGG